MARDQLCGGLFGRGLWLDDLFPLRTRPLGGLGAVRQDLRDAQHGDLVAIAALAARVLAAALLESDDLGTALVVEHLDRNGRACDRGQTQDRRVAADQQNFIELHDRADFAFDLAYFQDIIRNDAVLPAAGFDDCEHRCFPSCSIPASRHGVGAGFLSVVMGLCEFCAGGSYPFENPRKNKRREKRPAPVGGFIAADRTESRKSRRKRPDLKHLGPIRPRRRISDRAATNRFPRRCPGEIRTRARGLPWQQTSWSRRRRASPITAPSGCPRWISTASTLR